jgi:hypothetical protein
VAKHVAHTAANLKEKDHLVSLAIDGRIILRQMLKK